MATSARINSKGRPAASREERISKTMTYILRHGAEKEGIPINKDGYIRVSDLMKHPNLSDTNEEEIIRIVDACPKQRFAYKRLGDDSSVNGELYIRANQGHSLSEIQVEMKEITENDVTTDAIIHGTFYKAWDSIKIQGLSRMGRQHVHFVENLPTGQAPISGMRSSCQVAVYVDIKKALGDGIRFYRSSNDVILCAGDENGIIKTSYFIKAIDLKKNSELTF